MESAGLCDSCQAVLPHYTALRAWAYFDGPVRNAIHALKYKRDISLGEVLSRPMITCIQNQQWSIDVVVPVPLGSERLSQRGYNQAALLAFPLALGLGLPYRPRALQKIRETPSQVGLTMLERRTNVAGAFQARREDVLDQSILLVDDVTTSGATLDECATAMLQAGAGQVYGLTLARAVEIWRRV